MPSATSDHDIQMREVTPRLSVRSARLGLAAVLVAAVVLGVASLRYGSSHDASGEHTHLTDLVVGVYS